MPPTTVALLPLGLRISDHILKTEATRNTIPPAITTPWEVRLRLTIIITTPSVSIINADNIELFPFITTLYF